MMDGAEVGEERDVGIFWSSVFFEEDKKSLTVIQPTDFWDHAW